MWVFLIDKAPIYVRASSLTVLELRAEFRKICIIKNNNFKNKETRVFSFAFNMGRVTAAVEGFSW